MNDIQNFTRPKQEPVRFQIDDDVFEASPRIGAEVLHDLMRAFGNEIKSSDDLTPAEAEAAIAATRERTGLIMGFLDQVLLPGSSERFAERLRSSTEPIDMEQVAEVFQMLIGRYGGRPTQPSSPSTNGHDGAGTSSTVGAPVAT